MSDFVVTTAITAAVAAGSACLFLLLRLKHAQREAGRALDDCRSRSRQDLEHAHLERDKILDALSDAFLLVDSGGTVRIANAAARRFFNGRVLVHRPVSEVMLDRRLIEAVRDCLINAKPVTERISLYYERTSDSPSHAPRGQVVWHIDAAPIVGIPEQEHFTRIVIRDVSAEHQTDQIRKDFVANASHELRTPLAIINGYLENLIDDDLVDDPAITRRFLSIMRKHTERIARIVEDMLVISRLESGEAAALKVEPFRLRSCIQDVLERLESVIRQQKAEIHVEMDDETLTIIGDRFYWTQVLFNLIENALKQNPRPGLHVRVGARREPTGLLLWVADDGVGIPAQDLQHIFRRFYRVEKHHSQQEIKGTGLGLSIVKRAIEAHGGMIDVASTPGVDTRFTIRIPAEEELRLEGMQAAEIQEP
ncbi:two-component system phosphate regulon sensor histidine kinase PhoR [Haloferula luteola]|uniref:histidine kinase n=1 Tax=Haloferula luteola TaxID=595692 RepID=A0A840V1U1_9BACT|nr:ATP-binding protein [Haloferula luteola]MBB5351962.1 two-component system phosphate regulon sensor histidine kinase PhoR [Haloferula luteola]